MEADPLTILCGDALDQLRTLPDESVQCCVTSPPYWGLRDYSVEGQLGLEKTPEEYVAKMVEVFREVRRVLRRDGTLWLNLGSSYAGGGRGWESCDPNGKPLTNRGTVGVGPTEVPPGFKPKDLVPIPWMVAMALQSDGWWLRSDIIWNKPNPMPESVTDRPTKAHEYLFLLTKSANYFYDAEAIKEKGITTEEQANSKWASRRNGTGKGQQEGIYHGYTDSVPFGNFTGNRNKRSVWTVATAPYPEAHFATYPPDLIKPCIMAGTSAKGCCAKCGAPWERIVEKPDFSEQPKRNSDRWEFRNGDRTSAGQAWQDWRDEHPNKTLGWQPTCKCMPFSERHKNPFPANVDDRMNGSRDGVINASRNTATCSGGSVVPCTVLDPFAGSGTTGAVALELGRKAVLIELNPHYVALIEQRCNVTLGLALA